MQYSIIKDDSPDHTTAKIREILDKLKIKTKEYYYIDKAASSAPVSLRLHLLNNFEIGTNGKGTCIENAKASAYAEFMERLQNLMLIPPDDSHYEIPDKILHEPGNKLEFNDKTINEYFYKKTKMFYEMTNLKELTLLPFFSIKNKKVFHLPWNIISFSQGSNGMAAGNTVEEAIVQGLSEICERYAMRKIFLNKISLPNIPSGLYMKYENISNICSYLNRKGYNVYIKDASLSGEVPVVCTIVENKNNGILNFKFGSHPSFPVAIERTLTEYMQGVILSDFIDNPEPFPYYSKTRFKYTDIKNIFYCLAHIRICFENNDYLVKQFFTNETSYKFSTYAFADESINLNNKELLKFLTKKILKITEDIYVRDVSFLGFPSVDIFVPGMSEIFDFNKATIETVILYENWLKYNENKFDKNFYNIENLLKLSENYSILDLIDKQPDSKIFNISFEYIALLCSIVKKDKKRINKYTDILLDQNKYKNDFTNEQVIMFKIIKDYFNMKNKYQNEESIINALNSNYNKKDIKSAVECINEINFKMILNIAIKKKNSKKLHTRRIVKKLSKIYKNNIPDQMKLYDCLMRSC